MSSLILMTTYIWLERPAIETTEPRFGFKRPDSWYGIWVDHLARIQYGLTEGLRLNVYTISPRDIAVTPSEHWELPLRRGLHDKQPLHGPGISWFTWTPKRRYNVFFVAESSGYVSGACAVQRIILLASKFEFLSYCRGILT
jgi:hypothetical protein